jgi:hypothetical protein
MVDGIPYRYECTNDVTDKLSISTFMSSFPEITHLIVVMDGHYHTYTLGNQIWQRW